MNYITKLHQASKLAKADCKAISENLSVRCFLGVHISRKYWLLESVLLVFANLTFCVVKSLVVPKVGSLFVSLPSLHCLLRCNKPICCIVVVQDF